MPEDTGKPTSRQIQIFEHVSRGLSFKEVAFKLGISEDTVWAHNYNLRQRLSAKNATHAFRLLVEGGYITLNGNPATP